MMFAAGLLLLIGACLIWRRPGAWLTGIAGLASLASLFYTTGSAGAQGGSCASTSWTAESALETFTGTGPTLDFVPLQAGVFVVSVSQPGRHGSVVIPVCSGCMGMASAGLWHGAAWATPSYSSTGSPQGSITATTNLDEFPMCVSGSVAASTVSNPTSVALGWNINQLSGGSAETILPSNDGLDVRVAVTGATALRVEISGPNATSDVNQRWCAPIPTGGGFVAFSAFNADCVPGASGATYAGQSFATVSIIVPGVTSTTTPFQFCLNGIEQSDRCVGSLDLDDGDPGTVDRCDPQTGPVHIPIPPVSPVAESTILSAQGWRTSTGIQEGLAPGVVTARTGGLVRGYVKDKDGAPIMNVKVSVAGRPELGSTTTNADGSYDMLVNGGGRIELSFSKTPQYLEAARTTSTRWNGTSTIEDVILLRPDPVVTKVTLDDSVSTFSSATGSTESDDVGTRTGTVLFPPGVQALMVGADGNSESLEELDVRITEFTVGPNGPATMPATIAYNTAYTYAFEINADQAVFNGAPEILFSEPLPYYVNNYYDFPVGSRMPLGSYNRERGVWVPEDDGIVLAITGVASGLALLDVTGDGNPDDAEDMESWQITDAERAKLAELVADEVYDVGDSLWRVLLPHFTQIWDCNSGLAYPDDAEVPGDDTEPEPPPNDPNLPNTCKDPNGSIIECETQVLRERIPINGTDFSLNYSSGRVPGNHVLSSVRGKISNGPLPSSLASASANLYVAGRYQTQVFPQSAGNTEYIFYWDGRDQDGRRLLGLQDGQLTICYTYVGERRQQASGSGGGGAYSPSFGLPGGIALGEDGTNVSACRNWPVTLGSLSQLDGLGEWAIDVHHQLLGHEGLLLLGDGTSQDLTSLVPVLQGIAGTLPPSSGPEGPDPRRSRLDADILAVGPRGLYLNDSTTVRLVTNQGQLLTVAGGGSGPQGSGNDGPALDATLGSVRGLAVAPDGTLYIAESTSILRKVGPDGIIRHVAGTGTNSGPRGNGGAAATARFPALGDVAVAPDGSVYVTDGPQVRRIDANGIVTLVAGSESSTNEPNSGFPDDSVALGLVGLRPTKIAFSPSGELHILHRNNVVGGPNSRIYRLRDGKLQRLAGCTSLSTCPVGTGGLAKQHTLTSSEESLTFTPDGRLLFLADIDPGGARVHRVVTITEDGHLLALFNDPSTPPRDGLTSPQAKIEAVAVAGGPNAVFVSNSNSGRHEIYALTADSSALEPGTQRFASKDGSEVYVFDDARRHISTLDAHLFTPKYTFGYDAGGWLTTVTDARSTVPQVTTIQRNSAGQPTAIVGPFGQVTQLELNSSGELSSVTDGANRHYTMTYKPEGLLETFTRPGVGQPSVFDYTPIGLLITDTDSVGATITLDSTELVAGEWRVEKTTELGRTTTYSVEPQDDGYLRTVEFPDHTSTIMEMGASDSTVLLADGSSVGQTNTADVSWGAAATNSDITTTLPSGLTQTVSQGRTATLSDPVDPLTLTSSTETTTIQVPPPGTNRTTTTVFTRSSRTFLTTSPANRQSKRMLDTFGRTSQLQFGALTALDFAYDTRGRISSITQGARQSLFTYIASGNGAGDLHTITDPLGRLTTFTRDAAGRTVNVNFELTDTGFGWDPLDNLASVTPPGKPQHDMGYTPVNLLEAYTPPTVPGVSDPTTDYIWDLDRDLDVVSRPDGEVIDYTYGTNGKLESVETPTTTTTRTYYAPNEVGAGQSPGKLKTLATSHGVVLEYEYDGSLQTEETTTVGMLECAVRRNYTPT